MASICNISEHFCDWRSHIAKGDRIQAYDGRGWYSASVYVIKSTENRKDLLIGYDDYSSSYDFWCSNNSKRIRPTIGFLRKKIMLPQSQQINKLQKENEKLKEENERLLMFKNKFNEKEYNYLGLKKLSQFSENDDSSLIRDVEDQEEIEEVLIKNVSILKDWNKITKEFKTINDELNNKDKHLNIKDLVRIQSVIQKKTEIQQQRLESSQNNIITPIMNTKFKINAKMKEYEKLLRNIKMRNHNITRNQSKLLIDSLYDLLRYCNQKIEQENELNKSESEINYYINQYNDYSSSYFDLLKGYQKFQILNKQYIADSAKQIDSGWNKIESEWVEWTSDDILLWIQHKMNWINTNAAPKCLNFDVILENMEKKEINGKSLLTLDKTDLLHIGFNIYSHRTNVYQYIKSLITKNNNTQEGQQSEHTITGYDQNDIPQKYKCSLTNTLMTEPVICGHNNKLFQKTAIYNYIKENGKLPIEDAINPISLNDEASFLLFDDIDLKTEIELFQQEHHL